MQFEDTYTVHNADEWTGLPPTPPPARRDGQANLEGVNPAWVGGDHRSSSRGPSWPNCSTPGATGSFSRLSMSNSRDIARPSGNGKFDSLVRRARASTSSWRGLRTVESWRTSPKKRCCHSCQNCSLTRQPRGTATRKRSGPRGKTL